MYWMLATLLLPLLIISSLGFWCDAYVDANQQPCSLCISNTHIYIYIYSELIIWTKPYHNKSKILTFRSYLTGWLLRMSTTNHFYTILLKLSTFIISFKIFFTIQKNEKKKKIGLAIVFVDRLPQSLLEI